VVKSRREQWVFPSVKTRFFWQNPASLKNVYKYYYYDIIHIMELHKAQEIVRDLFKKQSFSVLATQMDKQPYTSLVAFASTADMRSLLFVTGLSTSKFMHIKKNPHVAMLIDNRLNNPQDVNRAAVVTVLGDVTAVRGEKREDFCHIYLLKHPHLKDFLQAPSSVLLALMIRKIILVTKFQQVVEWEVDNESSMIK